MLPNNDESLQTFWSLSPEEILKKLDVSFQDGLSQDEANKRLQAFGSNTLRVKQGYGTFKLLISQFNTPLVYMLLFAAGISLILYDKTDALIIFGIIAISTLLSFFQERGAVKAMQQLLKIVQIKALVIRDNSEKEIPIEEIVPGDILVLNAGDVIPGDCYLFEAKDLYVDEATLTGETFCTEKHSCIVPSDTPINKRSGTLFMGTHVVSGTAKAVVVMTGKNTEFGKISSRLTYTPPENEFEHGVRKFGYFLMEVTFVLLIIIFAFNIYFERAVIESLLFALALSVGLTPQLLPAIITINLAYGAKKMAKNRVIVKKLASIENFGSMDILCIDKTGTITKGDIELKNTCDDQGKKSEKCLLYAYLNASYQTGYSNPIDTTLKNEKINLAGWRKVDEIPYDFFRKRLSILAEHENTRIMITKGAFKEILSICTHVERADGSIREIHSCLNDISTRFIALCKDGYRVLGVAYRKDDCLSSINPANEKEMTFIGFLVFWDPIKDDVDRALKELKNLGIGLKIITGDNAFVASHVAKLVGLPHEYVLTGSEIHHMSDHALLHHVHKTTIFAEIEPNQKEKIILALRKAGNVVGFLGDGINDVSALHAADVSISVDTAADATKEVANIVLMEKDLSVLKEGVKNGRITFANTLKYIFMASSANFGNMFSMAGASLFLSFLPLLPKQVLLTNLMTDFPEMTIATDQVDEEIIQKPLRWNIHFIRKFMFIFGLISSVFDYATFGILLWLNASIEEFRTGWFVESIVSATAIVLVIRTFRPFYSSRPSIYLLTTVLFVILATILLPLMPFSYYLGFRPLPWKLYAMIFLIIGLYIFSIEFAKRKFLRKEGLARK